MLYHSAVVSMREQTLHYTRAVERETIREIPEVLSVKLRSKFTPADINRIFVIEGAGTFLSKQAVNLGGFTELFVCERGPVPIAARAAAGAAEESLGRSYRLHVVELKGTDLLH